MNRLEWTTMKIQRHVVGAFVTFKNPLVLCFVCTLVVVPAPSIHSVLLYSLLSLGPSINPTTTTTTTTTASSLFSSFLGEDEHCYCGWIMIVAKK
jgi:predicted solute-binding protein